MLSSIVFASLGSAKNKAKDASLKVMADQFYKVAILNFEDYNSYAQLSTGWVKNTGGTDCSERFSGNYAQDARNLCGEIYKDAGDWPGHIVGNYRLYTVGTGTIFSIMIYLNSGKWYCVGSSGRKGEYSSYSSNPGCFNNP